jgi:DNA-binding transcriptional LysR family regulator
MTATSARCRTVITVRLNQIRDFVAVVECGGIRAAARKLGVSQPAITRSVRGLETELHARLLQRTPTGVVLTESGRAFLARARAAQSELRKAGEEADPLGQSLGSVAFGVGPTAGIIVPDAINLFREKFPRTPVHVAEGLPQLLLPLVREGTLDFAICRQALGRPDLALTFRPLFRNDFVVVARKGHPLERARSFAELADANWVSLLPPESPTSPLNRVFSQAGLPTPRQVLQCESYSIAVALIEKTDMLGFLSRQALPESLLGESLELVHVADSLPSFVSGIFARSDTPLTQAAGEMAKAVAAAARTLVRFWRGERETGQVS